MAEPYLYVLVGLSGSGKSTWAKKLAEDHNQLENFERIEIVSSDNIRAEVWGDVNDQSHNTQVFEEMFKRTEKFLLEGTSVIYDATNLSAKRRERLLKRLAHCNSHNIAVVFTIPLAVCEDNDWMRGRIGDGRSVGRDVIWKQVKQFTCPCYGEGFEQIHFVSKLNNYPQGKRKIIFQKMLYDMRSFDQYNSHHRLTLGEHCTTACYSLNTDDYVLEAATFYHDLGKLWTQELDENDEAHYYGHQNFGTYAFLVFGSCGFTTDEILDIANLMQYHMDFYFRDETGLRNLKARIGDSLYEKLVKLHEADKNAH